MGDETGRDNEGQDAVVPEIDIPDPEIPEPDIPHAALTEPVIPPPPESVSEPVTRAARRSDALPAVPAPPTPSRPAPAPDPEVVPPASGATPGSYRGWTIAIYSILLVLLIGAIALILFLTSQGITPFSISLGVAAPLPVTFAT